MTQPERRGAALRWTLVAAVLALAAGVALWPRGEPPRPSTQARSAQAAGMELGQLRQKAALRPCPKSGPQPDPQPAGLDAAASPLAGVRVPCLGAEGTVDLGTALGGRVVLLNVWSHTCEPCREELPVIEEYAAAPGAAEVLGVQVDGSPQAGLALLTALGVHLPSVTDPNSELRAALAAPQVLPLSYVVRPDGGVRMVNPPVVFASPGEVDQVVRRYSAEAAGP